MKLKEELQADVLKEREGLTPEEVIEQIRKKIESSDSILAKFWRQPKKKKQAS